MIKSVHFHHNKKVHSSSLNFGLKQAEHARKFHQSFPEYTKTPLVELNALAEKLKVNKIFVKDESYRFRLNAFKVLGGSYAIGRYIQETAELNEDQFNYETLTSPELKEKLGQMTFITATDGNHGRGVAWTANRLKQHSVVYMPKGSAQERLDNIKALGSDASITEFNYDDAVRLANKHANENGWIMVQDTAWEGYEKIPAWIMQGYTTMALEIVEELGTFKPTHLFQQAGVGALAGAVTGFFADYYKNNRPIITIVEPDKADCIYKTAEANDGKIHTVGGDLNTIMAGLACGEPCTIGWNVLHDHADHFISMSDHYAELGMRTLGLPLGNDQVIVSGESGAATMGFVTEILSNPEHKELKEALQLNEDSIIICISTEGDTDKENYKRILNQ